MTAQTINSTQARWMQQEASHENHPPVFTVCMAPVAATVSKTLLTSVGAVPSGSKTDDNGAHMAAAG